MLTGVLLLLPLLYLILFAIWCRFQHIIRMMADVEILLNKNEFCTVDTPKEGAEEHSKRECLNGAVSKDKV